MSKLTKVSVSEAGVSGWDASLQMGEWVEHADELLVVLGAWFRWPKSERDGVSAPGGAVCERSSRGALPAR